MIIKFDCNKLKKYIIKSYANKIYINEIYIDNDDEFILRIDADFPAPKKIKRKLKLKESKRKIVNEAIFYILAYIFGVSLVGLLIFITLHQIYYGL